MDSNKQFPGKMDKTNKRSYKTTYKMCYGKLKHVKLFENFDQESEGKWFVAQEGKERFKFQAKDMDEATEYASKTWNAEVIGEADEDMEFEDTPMDENNESTHKIEQKYVDLFIEVSKDSHDLSYPIAQAKKIIESFVKAHNASGNEDWYTTAENYTKDEKEADLIGYFLNQLDAYIEDLEERTDTGVNEAYTDFLTSHGNELSKAAKQIKEIATVYDKNIEVRADKLEKEMSMYDENVGTQIDSWVGDSNISTDKIAKFAMANQDKYGTEPKMILSAIDDFHRIMVS